MFIVFLYKLIKYNMKIKLGDSSLHSTTSTTLYICFYVSPKTKNLCSRSSTDSMKKQSQPNGNTTIHSMQPTPTTLNNRACLPLV